MKYLSVFLLLLLTTGCANGNHARDYFGASHGPVGLDVCVDFNGEVAGKDYIVLRGDVVLEKYMEKENVVYLLGQPDEIKPSIARQEIWTYKHEPITLFFDEGLLTHWKKE